MNKISIEYIGSGLYEACLSGCDIRGIGCTEKDAVNNLLEQDIPVSEVEKIAKIEYIGYGLYEASHKETSIKCVASNKLGAVKQLYAVLLEVA